MNRTVRQFTQCTLLVSLFLCSGQMARCQNQKRRPGLPGMSPSKWITLRHTQAPGKAYRVDGSPTKAYTQEDFYFKMWIPVVNLSRFALLLGPQYRTEQLEFQSDGENPLRPLGGWNLRSMGLDIRSCVTLDSTSWLAFNANVNQSGNLRDQPHANVPINYTFSSIFIKRTAPNREIGFGFMVNKSFNRFTVLPAFMFNYNYSSKGGIEINLPYKIALRRNLSPTDLLYVRAEAVTRAYWINSGTQPYAFRRTEVDLGIAYNKQFTKLIGAEAFGGYRRNISTHLPGEITAVKTSGFVFQLELYLRSPFQ